MIQTKKLKLFIIFDDMIAYMPSNRKPNPIVTELFFRGRRLNISPSQSFEKYQINFKTLSYYENSKQTKTSVNCI